MTTPRSTKTDQSAADTFGERKPVRKTRGHVSARAIYSRHALERHIAGAPENEKGPAVAREAKSREETPQGWMRDHSVLRRRIL
jgi:hypothetical protein